MESSGSSAWQITLNERKLFRQWTPECARIGPAPAESAADRVEVLKPEPAAIRGARLIAQLTQLEAARTVRASLRGWQQWEAGDRTMPSGLFELFMLKTGQWPLESEDKK